MKQTSKLPMTLLPKVSGLKLENVAIDAEAVSFSLTSTSLRRESCEAVPGCKLARRFGPEIRLSISIASDNGHFS